MTMLTGIIGGGTTAPPAIAPFGANPGVLIGPPSSIFVTTPNGGNPLVPIGATGYPASGELRDGMAQTDGVSDYWFVTAPATFNGAANPFPTIELYTSPAGTNTWTYQGVLISHGAAGAWNGGGVFSPSKPVKVGSLWKMLVSGVVNSNAYWVGPDTAIGVYTADSLDGPWTEQTGNPVIVADQLWDSQQGCYSASVVAAIGGGWTGYYCGHDNLSGLVIMGLFTSTDLTAGSFAKQNPAFQIGPSTELYEEPALFVYNGVYWNLYDNQLNIGVLVSADGQHWLQPFKHLFSKSGWTAGYVGSCDVIVNADNSLNVLYNGANNASRNQLGVASVPAFPMGPTYSADVPSVLAATNTYSLGCDASNTQMVQIPGANFSFTSNYSFALWAKVPVSATNAYPLSKNDSTDNSRFQYSLAWLTGGGINFALNISSAIQSKTSTVAYAQDGLWHHLGVSISVGGMTIVLTLYFDGVAAGTATFTGTMTTFVNDLLMFVNSTTPGSCAAMQLCEAHAYGRVLSAGEFATLAAGGEPSTANLVSRFKCNEGSGHTLKDQVAQGALTPVVALPARPPAYAMWFSDQIGANVTNAGNLIDLPDLTGNTGISATAINGTLVFNQLSGWAALRNPRVTLAAPINHQPFCYLAVIKPSAAGVSGGFMAIIGGDNATGPEWQVVQTTGVQALNLNQASHLGSSNTPLSSSSFTLAAVTFTTPAIAFFNNGNADGTASAAEMFTFTNSYVGSTGGASEPFSGDITLLVACAPANLAAWMAFAVAKYGVG